MIVDLWRCSCGHAFPIDAGDPSADQVSTFNWLFDVHVQESVDRVLGPSDPDLMLKIMLETAEGAE